MDEAPTVGDLAREALAAYEDLVGLAEEIEDEWTYVNDLAAAWQEQIGQLVDEQGAATCDHARSGGHRPCRR